MPDPAHPFPAASGPRALWIRGALLSVAILLADQLSKWWVLSGLRLREVGQIPVLPFFDLTMVWNRGVSFGFLAASSEFGRWGLVILSGVIAVVFAIWMARAVRGLTVTALGLVIGGAVGNMIDRVQYGAVADFFDFGPIFPWVFNVADSAITIGALLLAIDLLANPDPPAAGRHGRRGDGDGGPAGAGLDVASPSPGRTRAERGDPDGSREGAGPDAGSGGDGGDGGGGGGGD